VPDPDRYTQDYDFSNFETNNPSSPKPGVQLDIQFANIGDSSLSLRNAIMDVRRADGALVNGIVTEDSLEAGLLDELLAESRADEAAASAAAAAASATAADAHADDLAAAAAQLAAVAEIIADGGHFGDYGSITEAVGVTTDYGSIA
jgi:hypothetical protein